MRCTDVAVFGVVREIPGEKDEVGPLRQSVDHLDGALECFRAEGIGRAIESDVRVTQLDEREWRHLFAIGLAQG
jgi:hypothetical protein